MWDPNWNDSEMHQACHILITARCSFTFQSQKGIGTFLVECGSWTLNIVPQLDQCWDPSLARLISQNDALGSWFCGASNNSNNKNNNNNDHRRHHHDNNNKNKNNQNHNYPDDEIINDVNLPDILFETSLERSDLDSPHPNLWWLNTVVEFWESEELTKF